jgi:hypothetical protein
LENPLTLKTEKQRKRERELRRPVNGRQLWHVYLILLPTFNLDLIDRSIERRGRGRQEEERRN